MNAVFSEFKLAICKFIVDAVHDLQATNPSTKESLDVVTEVASVFEYRDIQSFLTVKYNTNTTFKLMESCLALSLISRRCDMGTKTTFMAQNSNKLDIVNMQYVLSSFAKEKQDQVWRKYGYVHDMAAL